MTSDGQAMLLKRDTIMLLYLKSPAVGCSVRFAVTALHVTYYFAKELFLSNVPLYDHFKSVICAVILFITECHMCAPDCHITLYTLCPKKGKPLDV